MSRVRMPHNNRVSASGALKTNDIWSKTIGYDPYAATEKDEMKAEFNSLEQNENLKLLVKISNIAGSESRGGCKKCGMLGHLTFQCRNSVVQGTNGNVSESTMSSSDTESDIDVSHTISKRQKLDVTDQVESNSHPKGKRLETERISEKKSENRKHKHHKSSDKKKDKKRKHSKRKDKKER